MGALAEVGISAMAWARTVIESAETSREIDGACGQHPGCRDLVEGLKWRISREPESGYHVPGTDVYIVHSYAWVGFPGELVLAYTFTENETVIVGARVIMSAGGAIKLADSA